MKRIIFLFCIAFAILEGSIECNAQECRTSTLQGGAVQYSSKQCTWYLDLLNGGTIVSILDYVKTPLQEAFYILIASDFPTHKVKKGDKIKFRLSSGEVLDMVAERDYGDADRYGATNGQEVKFLQAHFLCYRWQLEKIARTNVIKIRIEFNGSNFDFNPSDSKKIGKKITQQYKSVIKYSETHGADF